MRTWPSSSENIFKRFSNKRRPNQEQISRQTDWRHKSWWNCSALEIAARGHGDSHQTAGFVEDLEIIIRASVRGDVGWHLESFGPAAPIGFVGRKHSGTAMRQALGIPHDWIWGASHSQACRQMRTTFLLWFGWLWKTWSLSQQRAWPNTRQNHRSEWAAWPNRIEEQFDRRPQWPTWWWSRQLLLKWIHSHHSEKDWPKSIDFSRYFQQEIRHQIEWETKRRNGQSKRASSWARGLITGWGREDRVCSKRGTRQGTGWNPNKYSTRQGCRSGPGQDQGQEVCCVCQHQLLDRRFHVPDHGTLSLGETAPSYQLDSANWPKIFPSEVK